MTPQAELVGQVARHFARSAPTRLGVAVSGGSDSLALLHLLRDWGGVPIEVVTVDHGLRPEAAAEAAYVADLCAAIGLRHCTLRWEGWDGKGNLQDQARRTRYSIIADWARSRRVDAVALGHTADDQAETLLMRLARGAGVDGLSAMRTRFHRNKMRFDRPLLALRRDDLRSYLSARSIRWVDDPTNEDDGFDRVKARRALEVLEPLGLDVAALTQVARNLRDASDALSHAAMKMASDHVTSAGGDLIFDRTALNLQPREIARRLLAGALQWVATADYPPRRAPLEDVMVAVHAGGNTALHGCRIMISDMTVRIAREHRAVAGLVCATDKPWDNRWRLDGPHEAGLHVGALGEALGLCPDWRATGLPRVTLLASPAVWRGDALVAAPVAGLSAGWTARTDGVRSFVAGLIAH